MSVPQPGKLRRMQVTPNLMEKMILVVDDSRLVRNQVEDFLRGYGYQTVSASNGVEGLKYLLGDENFDLVVLDAIMPVMGGRSLIEEIRSHRKTKDLPILVLTATEHVEMVEQCLKAGCNDYLVKPVNPRLLFQRVQALLENHPRSHQRVLCNVVAEVSTGKEQFVGEIQELCEAGAGLSLEAPLDEGDIVKLSFILPRETHPIVLGAQVVYSQGKDGVHQHGLNFVIADDKTRERIQMYVKKVAGHDMREPE
ncbi:response regulator [bacterium]|nr:MAG: response regulator [bacterium]